MGKTRTAAAVIALALSACGSDDGGGGTTTIKIAMELPFSGSELAGAQPIANGIKLAVVDAGGMVGRYEIVVPTVWDDTVNGVHDPQQGAQNMMEIVGDPDIVAVIGPFNSSVASSQIPISNEAGLLQCSPANTNPGLTKPEYGADDLHPNPDALNYVRVVTTDDVQAPASALYARRTLTISKVYVVDDTESFGVGAADAFSDALTADGGEVVARDSIPKETDDYSGFLTAAAALGPEAIYFGGVTVTGAPRVLLAAIEAGLAVPFLSADGIIDGPGDVEGSFINAVGAEAADNSYATLAGITEFPGKAEFEASYEAEYGEPPPAGYAGMGYACTQVVLDAIARADATNPGDMAALREAVRAAGVDTSHTYDTVLGEIAFDENGDTTQKIISIYGVDPAGAGGAGDWAFMFQIDAAD